LGSENSDGLVFAVVYGGLILVAVRVFGARRVMFGLLIFLGLAVYTALRTLMTLTGRRF
jgi:hypothetical protein